MCFVLRHPSVRILFLVFATAGCLGCGSGGDDLNRIAVSGRVEQGGQPLASGAISFLPVEGHDGPAANGIVEDGEYYFSEENGPTPGPHRVVIQQQISGKDLSSTTAPSAPWEGEMTIPESGPFEKNFTID
jgi:hypothetical protein